MPRDVIMPALGMAQDTGVLVAWLKQPGDPVAEGDALFEVETDKATMEVEAQAAGFLTDVSAEAGADVPVGQVIARISETAEGSGTAPAKGKGKADNAPAGTGAEDAPASDTPALPEGREVIMPALGMAQDTGLLVAWAKAPGDAVGADDLLFEVETDKSTMEVTAGHDGYVAALLAEAGEDVPVGQPVAIISADKPEAPVSRSAKAAPAKAAPAPASDTESAKAPAPQPAASGKADTSRQVEGPRPPVEAGGRILASPKLRRLALEQGLDLQRLVAAGYPQPFHVRDLDTLKALPADAPAAGAAAGVPAAQARRLTAHVAAPGFEAFARWAADEAGLGDADALLAGLAAASLRDAGDDAALIVGIERFGAERHYTDPDRPTLGRAGAEDPDGAPALRLRDLRGSLLGTVEMGAEDAPVLTLIAEGDALRLTLECAADQLGAPRAASLLAAFAGRMAQPLRHLL
ncbi:biotin/lipoyl-containing protein [Roseisalinus antarcticus]|uniref:Dihydrolipoyllysine-residue acetyltransferase component of pyruvate dehydrogenase complex n=1 Tax=Roseisalinus antarcticus TaxID=254357 RepID=A0A1Y5U480_9RHOB|nr:biotin/lipoyl-containing protein [Roseisalinus antarcticus]SLN77904.1 Dihydrolipoyllysine-residue acetyltransferase component of pyruvate dehydrogenase complex [Roseisalinus antarcticus]